MATRISMKHKATGIVKDGFYGFSWTTLLFGGGPALFRGDFFTFIGVFVVLIITGLVTFGIGAWIEMFIWAFFYNGFYTKKLLEAGYEFTGTAEQIRAAQTELNLQVDNSTESSPAIDKEQHLAASTFEQGDRTLENDAYKIFLVKNYNIEFNELLKKYIFNGALYESVDAALVAVHAFYAEKLKRAEASVVKTLYSEKGEKIIQKIKSAETLDLSEINAIFNEVYGVDVKVKAGLFSSYTYEFVLSGEVCSFNDYESLINYLMPKINPK